MPRIPVLNARLQGFGTSIFSEMTALANKHRAVNLGQGFPNFDPQGTIGREILRQASQAILHEGRNQYCRSFGALELTKAVQNRFQRFQAIDYDHESEITVYCGATEAIYCTFSALLEMGDEVVVFEPHYDSYRPSILAAGGRDRVVTLRPDGQKRFTFDPDELRRAFTPRTKAIILNSPHNPTGTVFNREELQAIADLCVEHDCFAVSDEVYDHILFDGKPHISIASLPGMRDRTITISSAGKTFSVTGWKVGWTLASSRITNALRTSHQFITFCNSTPFQYATAFALNADDSFFKELVSDYQTKRNKLHQGLTEAGFDAFFPEGTYFIQADVSDLKRRLNKRTDMDVCRWLTEHVGVCAIPSSAFYSQEDESRFIRFAFCKTDDVLDEAIHRLRTRM